MMTNNANEDTVKTYLPYKCDGCGSQYSDTYRLNRFRNNKFVCGSCKRLLEKLERDGDPNIDTILNVKGALFSLHLGGHV